LNSDAILGEGYMTFETLLDLSKSLLGNANGDHTRRHLIDDAGVR